MNEEQAKAIKAKIDAGTATPAEQAAYKTYLDLEEKTKYLQWTSLLEKADKTPEDFFSIRALEKDVSFKLPQKESQKDNDGAYYALPFQTPIGFEGLERSQDIVPFSPETKGTYSDISQTALDSLKKDNLETDTQPQNQNPQQPFLPYIFPGGSNLETELYTLGRALGAPKGSKGRGATIAGAAGAATLGAARDFMSGFAYENQNKQVMDWYNQQRNRDRFQSNPQTRNTNNTGGIPLNRDGGVFNTNYFEEGGSMEEQMMQQMQGQEQAPEGQQMQEQVQQEDPNQMMQQVMQAVASMLEQGQTPEQVLQVLVQQGIPQEQAAQIIELVMQQMQGQQPQNQQAPMTKDGQAFNARPGDEVTFLHGGKKVKGRVKEIKNGKVILE
jgi:hypothetical protein